MRYKLLNGYKYELVDGETVFVPEFEGLSIDHPIIKLHNRYLTVLGGYKWNGINGAPDRPDNMRGGLFHDVPYDLMKLGLLDRKYKDVADRLLQRICLEDGMKKFWADQFYNFVRAFGESHTFPDKHPKEQVIEVINGKVISDSSFKNS